MRIIPDDVKLTEGGYCDGLHYDASDTIEITDTELDSLFIRYKNRAINERRTFSQFFKELVESKRVGK